MHNDHLDDRLERLRLERRKRVKQEERMFMLVALLMTFWAMALVSLVLAAAYWLVTR